MTATARPAPESAEVRAARGVYGNVHARITAIGTGRGVDIRDHGASTTASAATNDAAVASARATSTGIHVTGGVFDIATTIAHNSAVPFRITGIGQSVTGDGSVLRWTGGASPVISLGSSCRGVEIENVEIGNTGSATVAVLAEGGDNMVLRRVMGFPTVGFSTAVFDLAPTTGLVAFHMIDCYGRGSARGLRLGKINAHGLLTSCRFAYNTVTDVEVGSDSDTPQGITFDGCTFDQPNGSAVHNMVINRAESLNLIGPYFEHHTTGRAIHIPSTATMAKGINVFGGFFTGDGSAAILSEYAYAYMQLVGARFTTVYPNPSSVVDNVAAGYIGMHGCAMGAAGMVELSDYAVGYFDGSGNVANGTLLPSRSPSSGLYVGQTQVLTTRRTGWTAATGTAARTTFATSTVTTEELAKRVAALLDDLIAHGVIGA